MLNVLHSFLLRGRVNNCPLAERHLQSECLLDFWMLLTKLPEKYFSTRIIISEVFVVLQNFNFSLLLNGGP